MVIATVSLALISANATLAHVVVVGSSAKTVGSMEHTIAITSSHTKIRLNVFLNSLPPSKYKMCQIPEFFRSTSIYLKK